MNMETVKSIPTDLKTIIDITRFRGAVACGAGGFGVVKQLPCNNGKIAAVKKVISSAAGPEAQMKASFGVT